MSNDLQPKTKRWFGPAPVRTPQTNMISAAIVAGSVIGVVMAMQSTSLILGTGRLWTGFAIAAAAGAASWWVRDQIPRTVRVIAVLGAVLALVAVVSTEQALDEKRQEILYKPAIDYYQDKYGY